jgi:hypothetical protein
LALDKLFVTDEIPFAPELNPDTAVIAAVSDQE